VNTQQLALPTGQLVCGEYTITYTIRWSRRARVLSLTIGPQTGLIVSAPMESEQEQIERFLRRHERWVLRQLYRWAALTALMPKRWPYGTTLPYLGKDYPVQVLEAERALVGASLEGGVLTVRTRRRPGPPGAIAGAGSIAAARRQLRRWYAEEARRWLLDRTAVLSRQLGVTWERLRVRNQRWIWGSCSARGSLNFNYRLVMAPPDVLEYVITHELLHRREMNHSKRFWDLMAARCPAYRDSITWLKTYGPYLTV